MSPELAPELLADLPLWQAVPDVLVLVGADGSILAVNDRVEDLLAHQPGDLVGRPLSVLVPAEHRSHHERLVDGYFADPASRPMLAGMRLEAMHADGSTVPVVISLSPVRVGDQAGVLAAVRDVSEAVQADHQVAEATRRRLLLELRERLARDLHDSVVQELFAIGMSLQSTLGSIEDGAVAERVGSTVDQIDGVIRHIRDAVLGQRAAGVGRASERLVAVAADLTPALGLPPTVVVDPGIDEVVSGELLAHLEPVLREALANVARHANAVDVDVEVAVEDDHVVVRVTDDGVGPPPQVLRPSGLANLAARAQEVGGSFELTANRPAGTRLTWKAPLGRDIAPRSGTGNTPTLNETT